MAWSEAEEAARRHDRQARAADLAVRLMTDVKRAEFDAALPGAEPTRHAISKGGAVEVTVAPLPAIERP